MDVSINNKPVSLDSSENSGFCFVLMSKNATSALYEMVSLKIKNQKKKKKIPARETNSK